MRGYVLPFFFSFSGLLSSLSLFFSFSRSSGMIDSPIFLPPFFVSDFHWWRLEISTTDRFISES